MSKTATRTDEFVTIIARTIEDAMRQYRAQGLDRDGYTIAHKVGRHRFSMVDGGTAGDLFAGENMLAATFVRSAN